MDNCLNFPCIPLEPLVKCTEKDRERHQTPLDQSTSQTGMGGGAGGNTGDFSSVWMSYNMNLGLYLQAQKFVKCSFFLSSIAVLLCD